MFYSKELNKGLLLILIVFSVFIVFTPHNGFEALFALSINALIATLFFSMTIELKGDTLTWFFGFGFWRKVVKVSDIVDMSFYQTKWYHGIGIRMLSDGWLYNASTGTALKLSLSGGKHIYIGCKDVQGLKVALSKSN
ncbi:hypothetical protein A3712_15460 [Vibrio sp. HI00D65]|uniref:hypothetical protein n=1 Tax=Vibrio sp. HI00D65 TaxID=1822216 RepID=UPI0007B88490|nr:hypothetical protein [Vibrio sp. HI00D65]KZX67707.1 hypothetical protein A3712_15460 [Vibrio sp. HI00D65]